MCTQIDDVYKCKHRSFAKFDNCPNFGLSCFGASGSHKENNISEDCFDCKRRKQEQNNGIYRNDPWRRDDPYKKKR